MRKPTPCRPAGMRHLGGVFAASATLRRSAFFLALSTTALRAQTQPAGAGPVVVGEAPPGLKRFDAAEFTLRVQPPPLGNPFTDAELTGDLTPAGGNPIRVRGFADSPDGSIFRLRFCPDQANIDYAFSLELKAGAFGHRVAGALRCGPSGLPGPVIVDPKHPRHFMYAGSGKPFFHLGYTAYHLLDTSNDDTQVDALIDYCAREGFNKIRFLLTGYPRDDDRRTGADREYGVEDRKNAPNYGARPGQVNALPAWPGRPHRYDFARFNIGYWQRVDRAVRRMREKGIIATCIFTIEKQNLPAEYGALTEAEYHLYRYAVSRLAAYDNVWWDLGNEHNEYRNARWGNTMGRFVKRTDPFHRLASAHAYADFLYSESDWADFIITQQYGSPRQAHDWTLKYAEAPKPYINEEYGYEGDRDGPGHNQNADRVRRAHWSIALAGGYATYGDWSGAAYYYMGEPGPGTAARQLKHLRAFFEALPFNEMVPRDGLIDRGFSLTRTPDCFVFYLPDGGEAELRIPEAARRGLISRWFDPRTGRWEEGPRINTAVLKVAAPREGDWALLAVSP